jgi:phage tail-like protein
MTGPNRGAVDSLPSAHPLGDLLPGVFLDDPMAMGFVAGLDPMLAPVHLTVDCLDAYIDPWLTPADFLPWLASWVAIELDEQIPVERRRAIAAIGGALHHLHGTKAGLVRLVELITGGTVEVRESGGVRWSAVPGADPPGEPDPLLELIVRVPGAGPEVQDRVERVVQEVRPAHLPFRVQVLP